MDEVNRDFALLDDEDEESNRATAEISYGRPRAVASPNPFLSMSAAPMAKQTKPTTVTMSVQRPRCSGQIKVKGLDDYIETYKNSAHQSSFSTSGSCNDRIKINLPIEDLSIKNENIYQTLDDHSIMTGDDVDASASYGTMNRRVSLTGRGSKQSSRRQSINDDNDNAAAGDDDDDNNEEDDENNLKYKYTASYKIDEQTGAFKENSKVTFEQKMIQQQQQHQQQQQQQQQKRAPPPVPPPPKVDTKTDFTATTKNQENKRFFNDFLTKSDDLIAKTQMKLEELSKKGNAPPPPAPPVQQQQPVVVKSPSQNKIPEVIAVAPQAVSSTIMFDDKMFSGLAPAVTSVANSKSLIDLKSFNNPAATNTADPTLFEHSQNPEQIDLLLDINHSNDFLLNCEPLKQGDSYYDLIGLSKSDSQYNVATQNQTVTTGNYPMSKELLSLSTNDTHMCGNTPLASPFQDEFLDFITSDNLLCFANPSIAAEAVNATDLKKEHSSSDLLGSIEKDLEMKNKSASYAEQLQQQQQISAPEIQITEPLSEQNDDNIVPDDLFNLRNEVPYNQSRPVTPIPTQVIEQPQQQQQEIKDTLLSDHPDNLLNDIEALLNSSAMSMSMIDSTDSTKHDAPLKSSPAVPRPTSIARPRFVGGARQTRIKKYVRKDGVMSNDDESSSEEEDNQAQFKIRIRPRAQSINSLNDENQATGFALLSKPPKTADDIEKLQQVRRSQESLNITERLADSSDDEKVTTNKSTLSSAAADSGDEADIAPTTEKRDRKQSELSEISIEMPDEDDTKPLEEFLDKGLCAKELQDGWILMIRYPLRNPQLMYKNALHKITEIRAWTETIVKIVDDGKKLRLFYPHDLENPFHEIELKSTYKFTDLSLQQYDTYTKIHTFKIQEIIFKEMIQLRPDRLMSLPERFLKHFTKPKVSSLLDHTPIPFEVIKFAQLNNKALSNFLTILQEDFWKLPVVPKKKQRELQREKQLQQQQANAQNPNLLNQILPPGFLDFKHAHEEITVKVIDEYKCKLDKKCRILEHRCRTRIYLVAFLNIDEPIIEIGLNDCLRHGKEIVGRHDIIPIKTEMWISPEIYEINESIVDKEEFEKTHAVRCVDAPDNQIIEVMRYRTRPRRNYELPLQVNCTMTIVKRKIEIKIECMIAGNYFTKISDVFCENIQIRFPLPDAWVYLFRVEKRFRYGAVHSTKSKFGKFKGLDRFLPIKGLVSGSSASTSASSSSTNNASMEASCGHAKYEQAFKAIVWRIDQLPLKNKDVYKTQLFLCRINLQEYDNLPEGYEPVAEVQYTMPICAASKSQVRSISVNTSSDQPPNKWVKLKTKFDYQLEISYILDQENDELPALNTEDCDELKHISQSESEVENDEENENDDDDNENIDNLDKIKQQPSEAVLIDLL